MVVDASPALAVLDKLVSNEKTTAGPVVGQPTNTQLIKQLTDELEQALGILNPYGCRRFKQGNPRRTY